MAYERKVIVSGNFVSSAHLQGAWRGVGFGRWLHRHYSRTAARRAWLPFIVFNNITPCSKRAHLQRNPAGLHYAVRPALPGTLSSL